MGDKSNIEWTEATWNPITGCTKVRQGCKHCYAERLWARLSAPGQPYAGRTFTEVKCHPERLEIPLHWRRPRMIFVNSMADMFHNDVPIEFIARMFDIINRAHWHTFQILTKRADRLAEWSHGVAHYPQGDTTQRTRPGWPPNAWIGVSVEDQATAEQRIKPLLRVECSVRFISYEPALGPIYISQWLPYIQWVIVGGESGPQARNFNLEWARRIIYQCQARDVPCFVKQLGKYPVKTEENDPVILRDRKGGDPNEWPRDLRVRQYPHAKDGL